MKYTITPDVAIVPIDGKPVFVPATDERYQALVGHLLAERFAEATALLATPDKLLRTWDARFTLTPPTVPFTIPQRWLRMASMDTRDLMLLSMETLRLLATRGFRIVGAARIPGGKGGLVAAINRVRGC